MDWIGLCGLGWIGSKMGTTFYSSIFNLIVCPAHLIMDDKISI
jgi:hypothetical protein